MGKETLGDFEKLILLAILHLRQRADTEVYGVPIMSEIERRTDRSVARAAVYVALRRLERKGLITSWMSDPTPERGGKSRRCVDVTPEGEVALVESQRMLDRMWGPLSDELLGRR